MANTVDKVIKIAEAEVGYLEKASEANLYDKTANAGSANYTKYGKEMHNIYPAVMDYPAAWCDAFIDWCFYKAYGVSNAKALIGGNFDDYTPSSAQLYKNKGAWYTSNPQIGDQIFFKNSTRICHTGLVYNVDSARVYTIEGNTSGASGVIANGGGVCKKSYSLNDSSIAGYGRPKYDVVTSTSGTYTVVAGDNLTKIGAKTGIDWKEIAQLNGIKAPYTIYIGQVLKLTSGATTSSDTYTVVGGDSLIKIGEKTGKDWQEIARLNNISAPYTIYVGQVLKLPNGSTSTTTSKPSTPKTKVTYTSHRIPTNSWGNEIVGYNLTNNMGYSGSFGKKIDKVAIKLSQGTITYTAHREGKWGNEIHGYSKTDTNNYAGSSNKPIDAIAIKATGINGKLKYRVHRSTDGKWGNWITGYSLTDTNNYAGSFGKPIDAIQIGIE